MSKKFLSQIQIKELLKTLKARFEKNMNHHNCAESYYAARGFRGVLKV